MTDLGPRIRGWTLTGLTVLFGMQLLRVLLPTMVYYLQDSIGLSSLALALIAFGIFALSFLAGALNRYAGSRRALAIAVGGVAILRVAVQFVPAPAANLYLSGAGVALFTLSIPIALGLARARSAEGATQFGYALLLGMAADSMLQAGTRTLDLAWQPGWAPALIIILLAAALLLTLRRAPSEPEGDAPSEAGWRQTLTLAVFGPWLVLQMIVFQNTARVAALTGWPLPAAGLLVGLGNALGLAGAAWGGRGGYRGFITATVGGVLFIGLLALPPLFNFPAALLHLGGQVLATALIMIILAGLGQEVTRPGLARTAIANGLGQLLFVLFTFVYYVSFVLSLPFRGPVLLPIAAVVVTAGAIGTVLRGTASDSPQVDYRPARGALVLLAFPLTAWLAWRTPPVTAPAPDNRLVRVMTYNLHQGFNTAGRLNLEALAQVIEASGADVIALQEVSRGWVINGSVDMLAWLSQRLQLPYVSGPTADAQWGNAILSRYPMLHAAAQPLPPPTLRLRRGYLTAEINIGGGTLKVIATHLHHVPEDSDIRQVQAPGLVAGWDRAPHTVILGDLNARPESPEMRWLAQFDLVDVSAAIGPTPHYTYYSTEPDHQLDYILATPDLALSLFDIPRSTASDHLPMIATLTMQ